MQIECPRPKTNIFCCLVTVVCPKTQKKCWGCGGMDMVYNCNINDTCNIQCK